MSQEGHKCRSAVALEGEGMEGRIIWVVHVGLIVGCMCGPVGFCHIVVCCMEGPNPLSTSLTPSAASEITGEPFE